MADTQDIPGLMGTAWLHIEADGDRIVACNAPACSLLGAEEGAIRGRRWQELLPAAEDLSRALINRNRCSLVPFILSPFEGPDKVVGGMLFPNTDTNTSATGTELLLWPLLEAQTADFPGDIAAGDIIAVLGVEHLADEASPGAANGELIAAVHAGLLGILRNRDYIADAVGDTLVLVLKQLGLDDAQDICRALLSHLRSGAGLGEQLWAGVRPGIGLAPVAADGGVLPGLLAANNALLRLRYEGGARIRVAAADDGDYLARRAADPYALFNGRAELLFKRVEGTVEAVADSGTGLKGKPLERGIEGYVADNMEGAVDQAIFLAALDIPIAIIGPAGTGKLYIANIIRQHSLTGADALVAIDCREFRSRGEAGKGIAAALVDSEGKTLVFKSPQLMSLEVQVKLARQLSSRTLADVTPARYLPRNQLVALFPDELEQLVQRGKLAPQLASAFAGYPIHVPPIRDRKQAVLRWAHKILEQEGDQRRRNIKGFTRDAEQAMLQHDWPGNITEMRQCITDALDKSDKEWITPVDLGLFKGISADGAAPASDSLPFLSALERDSSEDDTYKPSVLESLDQALGEAVNNLVAGDGMLPLGTWAEDDMVLAALGRYRDNISRAAQLLHTRARNISRWLEKIHARDQERNSHPLWQDCRRLLREWVRESPQADASPMETVQTMLLSHVQRHTAATNVVQRAGILGVSVPTYHKRLRALAKDSGETRETGE